MNPWLFGRPFESDSDTKSRKVHTLIWFGWCFCVAWQSFGAIRTPTGFWRGSQNRAFWYRSEQNEKKLGPGSRLKKTWISIKLWCQISRAWYCKKRFWHVKCCKLKGLGGHEIWWKMGARMASKVIKIEPLGAHGQVFWDLVRLWKDVFFFEFWDREKVVHKSQW